MLCRSARILPAALALALALALAGVALAAAVAAAPAAAAAPVAAFDLNGTLAPSAGPWPLADVGAGNAYRSSPAINGAQRYRTVRRSSALRLDLGPVARPAWSVVALVRIDLVSGRRRLLDLSGGTSDDGVYVADGRLQLWRGGVAVAGQSGPRAVVAGAWTQLVVTRSQAGELAGYLDGVPVLAWTDDPLAPLGLLRTLRMFGDAWSQATSGAVGRLRVFGEALPPGAVQALEGDRVDALAPSGSLDAPPGPQGFVGARPGTSGGAADAGSPSRVAVTVQVLDGDAVVTSGPAITDGDRWTFAYPAGAPPLAEGRTYALRAVLTDMAGNVATTAPRQVVSDGVAPSWLAVDSPDADATHPQPFIGGTAAQGSGDLPAVTARIRRLGPDGSVDAPAGTVDGRIDHGRWGGRTEKLPDGTYRVDVEHCDVAGNCSHATRTFRLARLPLPVPPAAEAPRGLLRTSPSPTTRELVEAQLEAVARRLSASELAKGTRLGVVAPGTGTVSLQIYAARPGRAVESHNGGRIARGRLLAQGRRSYRRAGRGRVAVAATRRGRGLLRRRTLRRVVVRLAVGLTYGGPVVVERAVLLRR